VGGNMQDLNKKSPEIVPQNNPNIEKNIEQVVSSEKPKIIPTSAPEGEVLTQIPQNQPAVVNNTPTQVASNQPIVDDVAVDNGPTDEELTQAITEKNLKEEERIMRPKSKVEEIPSADIKK
jgi:hypothetical protein